MEKQTLIDLLNSEDDVYAYGAPFVKWAKYIYRKVDKDIDKFLARIKGIIMPTGLYDDVPEDERGKIVDLFLLHYWDRECNGAFASFQFKLTRLATENAQLYNAAFKVFGNLPFDELDYDGKKTGKARATSTQRQGTYPNAQVGFEDNQNRGEGDAEQTSDTTSSGRNSSKANLLKRQMEQYIALRNDFVESFTRAFISFI